MNTTFNRYGKPGFATFLIVLSTGVVALLLTLFTYRQAINSQQAAGQVSLRADYSEKEDAILRALVAITPNRAIRAMQGGNNVNSVKRDPLRWRNIFNEALELANARTSISEEVQGELGLTNLVLGNSGDSSLNDPGEIFKSIDNYDWSDDGYGKYITAGINRSFGASYPPPLQAVNSTVVRNDRRFPLITTEKRYGNLATDKVGLSVSDYPNFNLLEYPQINFGYASPGEQFVAKQNWWAFRMNLGEHDKSATKLHTEDRNFVISIYEIPSQLAISAASFMSLGEFGNGESWGNVTISGGVFAGKAVVEGDTNLQSLASRRGMTLSNNAVIGGERFANNPFQPGVREEYQLTEGDFFPVSLASESGRVAFVPINRGAAFFDRFVHQAETESVSPTTWNNYSVGALQCAMRLDIIDCMSSMDPEPTKLRFSYMKGGVRKELVLDLFNNPYTGLPPGYLYACDENFSYNFGKAVVDVAYGKVGYTFAFEQGATGEVVFNNARFGDPSVGIYKSGYYRPSYPFEIKTLDTGKVCVYVYPQRLERFLQALNADDTSVNHSLVVNVDYSTVSGSVNLRAPSIPCGEFDYGVVLEECADLTSFPKGFSLVTNLRTYIGDDFNVVKATPPSGYTPDGDFYPPCSIFTPEKRYGVDIDPYAVNVSGQVGSLVGDSEVNPVRPLDSTSASGANYAANRITVNLKAIAHPAELPPISMMNWLITLTEMREEYRNY